MTDPTAALVEMIKTAIAESLGKPAALLLTAAEAVRKAGGEVTNIEVRDILAEN